jgi:hypothetical protein
MVPVPSDRLTPLFLAPAVCGRETRRSGSRQRRFERRLAKRRARVGGSTVGAELGVLRQKPS